MAFVEQHDAKIQAVLGDKQINWKIVGDKKIESPKFEYPISFGVEMEYEVKTPDELMENVEAKHLYRAQVADRLEYTYKNFAFAKHDGSLDNGFEVVSIPMSIDAHSKEWIPFLEAAEENGLMVRRLCGMHVHVSRELLTPLQIGKIMEFIFNKDNNLFIKLIAGRNKPVYTGKHGNYTDLPVKKITDVNKDFNRYSAFNICGAETIEFRLFKSTLDLHRMLTNIEFCDALIRLMWPSNTSIKELKDHGLKLFLEFVIKNRKRFPNLAEFLEKEGQIPTRKILTKYKKLSKKPRPLKKNKIVLT